MKKRERQARGFSEVLGIPENSSSPHSMEVPGPDLPVPLAGTPAAPVPATQLD